MKYLTRTIAIIIICSIQFSCSSDKTPEQRRPKLIKYQQISTNNSIKNQTYTGITEQEYVINLSFRNSGTITKFQVQLGQKVKKGQLLAKLDNVTARLAYEQAVTQKNAAKSNFNTAKLSLNRARKLYEKETVSLSEFEQAKNLFRTAKENYEASKKAVSIRLDQINYGHIYAPQDGVISAVHTELNENVTIGQPVATLNAGKAMEVTVGIPENVINHVSEGDIVAIQLAAIKNKRYRGIVIEVSPAISQQSSIYPVRIRFQNPSNQVKTGMAAAVEFNEKLSQGSNYQKLPVVPSNAIGEDYNGKFVFMVIKKDDSFIVKKHLVTIGELTQSGFEVTSGIKSGDVIAIAGLQTLLDGQEIRLQ